MSFNLGRKVPPILVVLGATGAGKSKLALELAQKFGGQIISADAMQMYKGLDIVTNKVTAEEREAVEHHLIDFVDPLSKTWTVCDFRNKALPILEDLLKRGIMPVICGGTNYYIESLLWKILLENKRSIETVQADDPVDEAGEVKGDKRAKFEISSSIDFNSEYSEFSTQVLHEKLTEIDPTRASELHPNERRKIIRSLQVFKQYGKSHGDILAEQKSQLGGGPLGGPLRFGNCLVLWVQCDQAILEERCNKRVEKMMQRGMVKELEDFHKDYNIKRPLSADYTIGIFQSIGFKEFHNFLMMNEEEKRSELGQKAFAEGVELLKLVTRQYSRKQVKWIRNRFLNPARESPKVYPVDSTFPELWNENCLEPAVRIVETTLKGKEIVQEPIPVVMENKTHSVDEVRKIFNCDVCNRNFKGIEQYQIHLKSKKHKREAHQLKQNEPKYLISVNSFNEEKKMEVLKLLKEITGMPFIEIKEHLQDLPFAIKRNFTEIEAKSFLGQSRKLGIFLNKEEVAK